LSDDQDVLRRSFAAVVAGDEELVKKIVQEAIEKNVDPLELIEKALIPGIREVGEKFERMELFLTGMMLSADAMKAGMNLLLPRIPKDKIPKRGTVVVGTVKGDIHEIGKNVLSALLIANGFDVHDLGSDIPASAFVRKAEEVNADIIAASALMTTTLPSQKDILDYLKSTGKRDKYLVLVGGGPASAEWAEEIGADGYAETAVEGASLATKKLQEKSKMSAL
jgi:corrinoid protein of di/trimethylamine methyltransferase